MHQFKSGLTRPSTMNKQKTGKKKKSIACYKEFYNLRVLLFTLSLYQAERAPG